MAEFNSEQQSLLQVRDRSLGLGEGALGRSNAEEAADTLSVSRDANVTT
jgi:hypothetical protein